MTEIASHEFPFAVYFFGLTAQIVVLIVWIYILKRKRRFLSVLGRRLIVLFLFLLSGIIFLSTISLYVNLKVSTGLSSLKDKEYQVTAHRLNDALAIQRHFEPLTKILGFSLLKSEEIAYALGIAYYNLQQYSLAIDSFQKSLLLNKKQFPGTVYLAHAYLHNRQHKKATTYYKEAVKLQPSRKDFFYFYNIGLSFGILGEFEKGIEAFNKAVEIKPERKDVFYHVAGCYSMQGKRAEALSYLRMLKINDEKLLALARNDKFFDNIKDSDEFRRLFVTNSPDRQ